RAVALAARARGGWMADLSVAEGADCKARSRHRVTKRVTNRRSGANSQRAHLAYGRSKPGKEIPDEYPDSSLHPTGPNPCTMLVRDTASSDRRYGFIEHGYAK